MLSLDQKFINYIDNNHALTKIKSELTVLQKMKLNI